VGWATAPVFIRGFSTIYDPYTQSLLRYGSAAVFLLALSLVFYRKDLRTVFCRPRALVAIAALNVIQQCAWVNACYLGTATMAQMISKVSTVFVIAFSFFLFREERTVIRSPVYLGGTLLSFAGVALVLCKDGASLLPQFDAATWLALFVAASWAVYTVWCKHLVSDVHPVAMFTVLALYTTLGFAALSAAFGEPRTLLEASGAITVTAIVSGLVCIAMAHSAYHYAQKHLGSAFCSSFILLNPLLTNAMALYYWSDERLFPTQWVGAATLLGGTFLVVRARREVHQQAPYADVAPGA